MHFCGSEHVRSVLEGKRVAIVGSGPGALDNEPGFVDSHDVVVRVNNHKCTPETGFRTDVHFSFYGSSIRVPNDALFAQGCKLVMCKCPNAKLPIDSEWHRKNNKPHGTDFRYIYELRRDWWFCPTYVPSLEEFMHVFTVLDRHIPSTGFSAFMAVITYLPAHTYLTGFDFFSSRIHNVNEPWRPGNPDDPIGHAPEAERKWLRAYQQKVGGRVSFDPKLTKIMEG